MSARYYQGKLDSEGVTRVTVHHNGESKDLPMFVCRAYGPSHDWRWERGLKQLALDILIDHLDEHPDAKAMLQRERGVAAWLPHTAYFITLLPLVHTSEWRLDESQVAAWLRDYLEQNHYDRAIERYKGTFVRRPYYVPLPFADWNALVNALLLEQRIDALQPEMAPLPTRFLCYIGGWMPEAIVIRWMRQHITRVEHTSTEHSDEIPF